MTGREKDAARGGSLPRPEADARENFSPQRSFQPVAHLLPSRRAAILEIGAGNGQDAAWLAAQGHSVVAVESSPALLAQAQRRHAGAGIVWVEDSLPALGEIHRMGAGFDGIFASAVWMHIPPQKRAAAFRRMTCLLKPKGVLSINLRSGPPDAADGGFATLPEEIETLARKYALSIAHRENSADGAWHRFILQMPDDNTGALPLLRRIILDDSKSYTYKLGLLRSVMRIAVAAQGMARSMSNERVAVPLGLVALNWLRLYQPLLLADNGRGFSQGSGNDGIRGLGFVRKELWPALARIEGSDLRVGAHFSGETAHALHKSIRAAVDTIADMPARRVLHPTTRKPVFAVRKNPVRRVQKPAMLIMNANYLRSFGALVLDEELWRALARFHNWIDPALVMEWTRLMETYAEGKNRALNMAEVAHALRWRDNERDVALAANRIKELTKTKPVFCVWSGKKLNGRVLIDRHIDHCLPRAIWPCEDLWNLMPTSKQVNQNKGKKMPTAEMMERSGERIMDWWDAAWMHAPNIADRFITEATASLPIAEPSPSLEEVFDALQRHRFAIRADQQPEEWSLKAKR